MKIALVAAVTAIIVTGLNIYFSPYWACVRETTDYGWCARAVGNQIPFWRP